MKILWEILIAHSEGDFVSFELPSSILHPFPALSESSSYYWIVMPVVLMALNVSLSTNKVTISSLKFCHLHSSLRSNKTGD